MSNNTKNIYFDIAIYIALNKTVELMHRYVKDNMPHTTRDTCVISSKFMFWFCLNWFFFHLIVFSPQHSDCYILELFFNKLLGVWNKAVTRPTI